MKDAKEKRSNVEILDNELEEKILRETYKAIEYDEDCKSRAREYSKLNIEDSALEEDFNKDASITITGIDFNEIAEYSKLKSKLRNIFNSIKLALVSLIKSRKNNIEKTETVQKKNEINDFDLTQTREKNSMLDNGDKKYATKEMIRTRVNSGPIFYNIEQAEYGISIKNRQSIMQREKYNDTPNMKGDEPDKELEI